MTFIVPAPEHSAELRYDRSLTDLLYPGYAVTAVVAASHELRLTLRPTSDAVCPQCGQPCDKHHETRVRTVREAPVPGQGVVLVEVPVRRVRCRCGCHRNEVIPWLAPHERMTCRMISAVQRRMRDDDVSVSAACREFGLGWDVVRRLDREQLEALFSTVVPGRMKRMVIDEIAIHKGQKYVTIFMDYDSRQVFEVVQGKSIEALRPAFERLRETGIADQVEAVGCDMNAAFPKLVCEYMPNADVVYDLFHVVKLMSDGLIKEARQKQATAVEEKYGRRSKNARDQRRILRSSEYLIVTPQEVLKPSAREHLQELIENNGIFARLHPLVEQVKCLWRAWTPEEAADLLAVTIEEFKVLAEEFGLKKAMSFARTLTSRRDGILKAGVHRISTGPLEGVNTRAKLIKRIGYGYRDLTYFALKLKAAFPGKGINPMHVLTNGTCLLSGVLWETLLGFEGRRGFACAS